MTKPLPGNQGYGFELDKLRVEKPYTPEK